jgi:hypothetical protein
MWSSANTGEQNEFSSVVADRRCWSWWRGICTRSDCPACAHSVMTREHRRRLMSRILRRIAWMVLAVAIPLGFSASGVVRAQSRVEFALTDQPGRWFDNEAGPVAGNRSLAVATPGVEVRFSGRSHTVHTMSSLLWPAGADGMPFDTRAMKGSAEGFCGRRGYTYSSARSIRTCLPP